MEESVQSQIAILQSELKLKCGLVLKNRIAKAATAEQFCEDTKG